MSVLDQGPRGRDLIDVLANDHREMERAFAELESGLGTVEHRGQLRDVVIAELVRHAVVEEQYLYPTIRETLPDGDSIAEREITEYAGAERLMRNLEGLHPANSRFDVLTADLIAMVRHHIEYEESDLFPRLRQACTAGRLEQLVGKVEVAKRTAPARPHPGERTANRRAR